MKPGALKPTLWAGVFAALCVLLLPAQMWGYGGGGGGMEEGNVIGVPAASGESSTPPEGFDPSGDSGLDDMFTDFETGEMSTSSAGSGSDQRDLEDAINEQAGISESQPQSSGGKTPRQQANDFLDTLPPGVRQQLISRYTPEEIVTIRTIGRIQDAMRTTRDPVMQQALQESLVMVQQNFVKNVNIRRQQRAEQLQRTEDDFKWVCGLMAGTAVNFMTAGGGKAAIAVNIAYNAATGGKKGAATATATTVLMSPFPGGNTAASALQTAVRDTAVQEGMSRAVDAYNAK